MWLGAYDFLHLVPKGRDEDGLAFPQTPIHPNGQQVHGIKVRHPVEFAGQICAYPLSCGV
jgi:hypothetical protein